MYRRHHDVRERKYGGYSLDDAPVVSGDALATALPTVHPLAELGEVFVPDRLALQEQARGRRKPLCATRRPKTSARESHTTT